MNEQPPLQTGAENQNDGEGISRRDATKAGLAAAGLLLIGGGSILKMRLSNDEAVEMPLATVEPSPELTPDDYADPEQTTEVETSYVESKPLGNAEFLRTIAEDEGEAKLAEFFRITKEEAPTPSALTRVLSERIRDWITGGCTPEEAGHYTADTVAEYVAEMSDKYGIAAATGLGGRAGKKSAPGGDISQTELYQKIRELHEQVLTHYLNMLHDGTTDSATITAEMIDHEMLSEADYQEFYRLAVSLKFTITSEQTEPLTLSCSLNLAMDNSSPAYQLMLD